MKVLSNISITVFGPNIPKGKNISTNKDGHLISVNPSWGKTRLDFKKGKKYDLTEVQSKWKSVLGLIKSEKLDVLESDRKEAKKEAKIEADAQEIAIQEQRNKLFAKAEELGLAPRKNATVEKLQEMIKEKEAE